MKAVIINYKLPLTAMLKSDSVKDGTVLLSKGLKEISMAILDSMPLETLSAEIVSTKEIEVPDDTELDDIEIEEKIKIEEDVP